MQFCFSLFSCVVLMHGISFISFSPDFVFRISATIMNKIPEKEVHQNPSCSHSSSLFSPTHQDAPWVSKTPNSCSSWNGHALFLAAWTAECPPPPASTKPCRPPHKPEDLTVRNTGVCCPPLVLALTVSQCGIAVPHLSKRGHHLDTACSPAPKPPPGLHTLKSKLALYLY